MCTSRAPSGKDKPKPKPQQDQTTDPRSGAQVALRLLRDLYRLSEQCGVQGRSHPFIGPEKSAQVGRILREPGGVLRSVGVRVRGLQMEHIDADRKSGAGKQAEGWPEPALTPQHPKAMERDHSRRHGREIQVDRMDEQERADEQGERSPPAPAALPAKDKQQHERDHPRCGERIMSEETEVLR